MTSVLIDGHVLWTEARWHGLGRYLTDLLEALAALDGLEVTVATPKRVRLPTGVSRVGVAHWAPHRVRSLEHELSLDLSLRRTSTDVFHGPALGAPRRCDRPWVQTVHDLIPLQVDHPHFVHQRGEWLTYLRRIANADRFIVGSAATATALVEHGGIDPGLIDVVPYGVHARFTAGAAPRADPPHVLQLGVGPHKGLHLAAGAIDAVASAGLPQRLVVTGRVPEPYQHLVDNARAAMQHPDRLEVVGHVDDEYLIKLLRGADALLVTSDAEGFGLPALEAMAAGVPVIATATPAVSEVVGDAGVLVEHGRVDCLAEALVTLLRGETDRTDQVRRGLARAAQFTWERCAEGTRRAYRAAVIDGI